MKKILLILFVLIFNFSYGNLKQKTENITLRDVVREKMMVQSNNFSKCFKTGLRDFEEMDILTNKFIKVIQKSEDIKNLSPEIIRKRKDEILDIIYETLEVAEELETRLDHLYYFHALEIPNDMDVTLVALKKQLIEIRSNCYTSIEIMNTYL